jgi:hypothetical protein
MQQTAVELRLLLEDINSVAGSDDLSRNVTTSVDQTRQSMQTLVSYITLRILLIIAALVLAAIVYRLVASRLAR